MCDVPGVYESPTCLYKPDDLDHAVLVVGYGTSANGHDFWIIRNSWSTYWGNQARPLACLSSMLGLYRHAAALDPLIAGESIDAAACLTQVHVAS